uniref:non-specific serine/threonine protein kinase n=1 Tax=Arcella intermedia TaxID=1963864 RepID=A0A6B2LBW7_9EUKA
MAKNYVLHDRYLLTNKIGKGGFGLIYEGVDLDSRIQVAIKIENIENTKYLKHEASIYKYMYLNLKAFKSLEPIFPQVFWYGSESSLNILVMELLGPNLNQLMYHIKGFTLKTICMLAINMITNLEILHSLGIIHCDLKPENFLMGRGDKANRVYLIDFGLSAHYLDENLKHKGISSGTSFQGTLLYASVNSHMGISLSRRDDLESLGYILIYFLKRALPWTNKKEKKERWGEIKRNLSVQDLTDGLPEALALFFKYIKQLEYEETPNYSYLRDLFLSLMNENGFTLDLIYDWI